jgi:uncharacterized protein (TIGR00369 family)
MSNKRDDEMLSLANHLFVETSPYTAHLGLKVKSMAPDNSSVKFANRDDLTGSARTSNLHGGVIAAVLDLTGSLVVFSNVLYKIKGQSLQKKVERFNKLSTIDLRIDYLRPGAGKSFVAKAFTLRTGSKVAVTRMELRNEDDLLIAVGTGSYILSLASE